MDIFLKSPKIELHAHLNGSLSDESLNKLIENLKEKGHTSHNLDNLKIAKGTKRTLNECFQIFNTIHTLCQDIKMVGEITLNVIREFFEENVCYLELRTTPKKSVNNYTKEDYIKKVVESIILGEKQFNITVRLLLSFDRSRGLDDAWDTLHLCKNLLNQESYKKYICGIDISGDPAYSSLKEYVPLLQEARSSGLKLAIHLLEDNTAKAFEDASTVIELGLIDRIGHGTFLHPESGGKEELYHLVKKHKIPLELCLTSNVKCTTIPSFDKHHVRLWQKEGHPFAICTDDKGVFCTSLTKEISIFHEVFGATEEDIRSMMLESLNFSFLNQEEKERIKKTFFS